MSKRMIPGLAALLIGLFVLAGCGTPTSVSGYSSSGYYGGSSWSDPHYTRHGRRGYSRYYGRRSAQPPVFRPSSSGMYSIPSKSRF